MFMYIFAYYKIYMQATTPIMYMHGVGNTKVVIHSGG